MNAWLILALFYLALTLLIGRFMHFSIKGFTKVPNSGEISGYEYEDIDFSGSENNKLAAWFVKSKANHNGKTIIIIPGWNHTRSTLVPHLKLFANNGYNVFTYDQRSHGGSDTRRLTWGPRESEDFIQAIKYLQTRDDVNINRIGVFGESIGGSTVIHAIAQHPETRLIKALLLEGTWAKTPDIMVFVIQNRFKLPYLLALILSYLLIWPGTIIWGMGKPNHAYPIDFIDKVAPIPIMFIRGQNDHMVPEFSAMEMINKARDPKEIWILPDSHHRKAFQTYPEEYSKRVLDFFSRYIA